MESGTVNVLVIDDNSLDAEMELRALRQGGIAGASIVAGSEAELRVALNAFEPDIILCDMALPDLDGFAAQRIVRSVYPDTPLIFVTGTVSENRAVMALQSGAVDYILKANLARLPSAALHALNESRERRRLEDSLRASEERSRQQSERLNGLWRIVNTSNLRGSELILAMLSEAAAALRPGRAFFALLGHVDGEEYVFDAFAGATGPPDSPVRATLQVGRRLPLSHTVHVRNLGAGRTQWWDDVQELPSVTERQRMLGLRSQIATQFTALGKTYVLTLASLEPPSGPPFDAGDTAYVEVLGAVFARQLELAQLEEFLRDEEERSRHHAERLEALWRIVNDQGLDEAARWLAMLEEAAAAVRPGQGFQGSLWRVQGSDLVIEAVTGASRGVPGAVNLNAGAVRPLAATAVGKILAEGGGTKAWDDLQASPYASEMGAFSTRARS